MLPNGGRLLIFCHSSIMRVHGSSGSQGVSDWAGKLPRRWRTGADIATDRACGGRVRWAVANIDRYVRAHADTCTADVLGWRWRRHCCLKRVRTLSLTAVHRWCTPAVGGSRTQWRAHTVAGARQQCIAISSVNLLCCWRCDELVWLSCGNYYYGAL